MRKALLILGVLAALAVPAAAAAKTPLIAATNSAWSAGRSVAVVGRSSTTVTIGQNSLRITKLNAATRSHSAASATSTLISQRGI